MRDLLEHEMDTVSGAGHAYGRLLGPVHKTVNRSITQTDQSYNFLSRNNVAIVIGNNNTVTQNSGQIAYT